MNHIEISQFIATKLCHDLAGSIGAINSALEFIESDKPEMKQKAFSLIKMSSEQSVHRLVFFRNAYGIAKHQGEANLDEIKIIASDYFKYSKVKLIFSEKYFHLQDVFISSNQGKLMLCTIHHAYLSLIHGGEVIVTIEKEQDDIVVKISASGQSPKIDIEKNEILNGDRSLIDLSTVNCLSYFTKTFADDLNVRLSVNSSEINQIEYKLEF
jgi:histidine phosphotransferase ChpT